MFLVPRLPDGPVNLRIDLRNYGSRSHQVKVTVNKFLNNGRKTRLLCREIAVSAGAANFLQIEQMQGAEIEVLIQGSQTLQPSVALIQKRSQDNFNVLLQILPKLFTTL
jgi:hypothetical protein